MDQVYDKLTTEIPFDAVANNINSNIMEYKNGKDEDLVNGQTDAKEKKDYIDAFYNHLKKELLADEKGSSRINSNGTEIGRFLFTNSNDMIEKATESFGGYGGENDNIIKTLKFIIQKQVIPSCGIYIKLNKDVRNLVKKGFAKNIKLTKINDYKEGSYKGVYLKNILEQIVGDVIIDTSIDNLNDFLRDSINTFTKNSDSQDVSYYSRYAKRYKMLSDLVSKISINTNDILDSLENVQKNLFDDGEHSSNIDDSINKLSASVSEIERAYNEIEGNSITKDDDFFPWIIQKYKINVLTFSTTPTNKLNNEFFDGMTKFALEEAIKMRELKNSFVYDNEKIIFATVKSSKQIDAIITEMQKYYNSLNTDLLLNTSKKHLLDIVGEITLDEYVSQIDKYKEITKTFTSNVDETIGSLIDNTIRVSNILGTLSSYTSRTLDKINPTSSGSEANMLRMLASIAGWTCVDILTVLHAMHYINANDLVMKLFLYENTTKFINYINNCINSSNGDKNDK